MVRAFNRDFERNGPSTLRIVRTTLAGWKRYKNHPDARVRRRFAWEARELATTFSAATAGAKMYYRRNPAMRAKMAALLKELNEEFGWKSRLMSLRGRAVRLLEAAARGEASGRRLDLRAADLLREERAPATTRRPIPAATSRRRSPRGRRRRKASCTSWPGCEADPAPLLGGEPD